MPLACYDIATIRLTERSKPKARNGVPSISSEEYLARIREQREATQERREQR